MANEKDLDLTDISEDDVKRFFAGVDDAHFDFPCEADDHYYVLGYNASKLFDHKLIEKFEELAEFVR